MYEPLRTQENDFRVLMFSPHPGRGGGVIDFVDLLARGLASEARVDTFRVGARGERAGPVADVLRLALDASRLFRKLLGARFDIVHINPSLNKAILREALAMFMLRLFGRRGVVVFIHGWDPAWEARIGGNVWLRRLFRWLYGNADMVLVLAGRFRGRLLEWGFVPDRVRVVSTMFDGQELNGVARSRGDGDIQLLFLSRFVPAKGGADVLEAFSLLCDEFPWLRLVCAGDGPERESMQRWVAEHALDGRVRFPGFVRGGEKAQILMDSDIFVFPTRHGEGCPVSLLEAMAAGLAVVTSDAGGIPDVFEDGANGVLLRDPSPEQVAGALRRLLGDPAKLEAVRANNRATAWRRFEATAVTREIEQIYRQVAKEAAT